MQTDATCWSTTPSIVECYMLRPFAYPVTCCCVLLEVVVAQSLNTGQTFNFYWANNVWSCCVRFFVALAIVLCCGYFSVQSFVLDRYHLMLVRSYRTDMHDSQSELCQDDVPLKHKCLCYNSCRRPVPCRFGKSLLKSQNV